MLYSSIAYRGLSMVTEFGQGIQMSLLAKAEIIARNIKATSTFEKIVAAENLYTCLQTLSKWHLSINDLKMAENYLLEMIKIDQQDSTGYSELGFVYIKKEAYIHAVAQFKRAIVLGPPGAGMNAYYCAKCNEQLGNNTEAISYLYQSTNLDKQAVSPWLDLMNYFIHKKQLDKAREIAAHIYQSTILTEQLEDDEIITVQNYIR